MLALFRIFKNLQTREHFLRTRYHKEHPHFLRYIAVDAILTVVLVSGVTAFASANGPFDRNPHLMVDLGLSTLTEAQLKTQVQQRGVDIYWIGPMEKTDYKIVVVTRDPVTVSYVSVDAAEARAVKPYIAIQTYNNAMNYYQSASRPIHGIPDISAINSKGNRIFMHPNHLDKVIVELTDVKKIVVITYSTPQSEGELIEASEKLHSVL